MKQAVTTELQTIKSRGKEYKRRVPVKFDFTAECKTAFRKIQDSIIQNILHGGDPHIQYHLAVDASQYSVGGVLFQMSKHPPGTSALKIDHADYEIIMFMSWGMSEAEKKYHTSEREALSVIKCLEECRWLVVGADHPTKVYTDHESLIAILNKTDARGRISRWQYRLTEYDVEYIHLPGKKNALADGLSRIRHEEPDQDNDEDFPLLALPVLATEPGGPLQENGGTIHLTDYGKWLRSEWYKDTVMWLGTGELPQLPQQPLTKAVQRKIAKFARNYALIGGSMPVLVYRERTGEFSRCLVEDEVALVLRALHDMHGHMAADITVRRCVGKYFWPDRIKDIHVYCRSCLACQMIGPLKPSKGVLPVLQLRPLDMLALDYMGPISPRTLRGHRYILVIVDYFSRHGWITPTLRATSATTWEVTDTRVIRTFGQPRAVYTDNGRHFVGGVFPQELDDKGVHRFSASPGYPQSVGLAERYVRMIKEGLQKIIQGRPELLHNWDLVCAPFEQSVNTRSMRQFGFTPCQLLMGFNPNFMPEDVSVRDQFVGQILRELDAEGTLEEVMMAQTASRPAHVAEQDEIRTSAIEKRLAEQVKIALKSEEAERFQTPRPGDLVMLRRYGLHNQRSKKLEPRWTGPYLLKKVLQSGRSTVLQDLTTGKEVGRYAINHLKVHCPREKHEHGPEWIPAPGISIEAWRNLPSEESSNHEDPQFVPRDLPVTEDWEGPPEEDFIRDLVHFPDELRDEHAPGYWERRAITFEAPNPAILSQQ